MFKSFFKLFSSSPAGGGIIFHPKQTCPECGSRMCAAHGEFQKGNDNGASQSSALLEQWICPNPDCPAQVRRGLVHWCSAAAMDIPGGDEKLVALLVKQGLVRDVAELYRLKVNELAALPGLDQDAAQKFFDAITASMKREAWRVLFGLGIPLVGAAEAQALGRGFPNIDVVFAAGVPRLMEDGGVSEAVAKSIGYWHGDSVNRKLVKRLDKFKVNLKSGIYTAQTG